MYIINENESYDLSDAIQNILEKEITDNQTLTITATCEHYIELINSKLNGELYRTIQLIDDKNIKNMKFDKDIIGFQFYDMEKARVQIGEKQYNLTTGKKNISNIIYRGNRILVNNKPIIICYNGYVIVNPNSEDITLDEMNSIDDIQKTNVYTKKKTK